MEKEVHYLYNVKQVTWYKEVHFFNNLKIIGNENCIFYITQAINGYWEYFKSHWCEYSLVPFIHSDSLIACLSALYGKLLVVMGMAFPIAEVISHDIPVTFYNVSTFFVWWFCNFVYIEFDDESRWKNVG